MKVLSDIILTFLSSLSQAMSPLESLYWRPKYHVSRRPKVRHTSSNRSFPLVLTCNYRIITIMAQLNIYIFFCTECYRSNRQATYFFFPAGNTRMGTFKWPNCAVADANVCLICVFVMTIVRVFALFWGHGRPSLVNFRHHGLGFTLKKWLNWLIC